MIKSYPVRAIGSLGVRRANVGRRDALFIYWATVSRARAVGPARAAFGHVRTADASLVEQTQNHAQRSRPERVACASALWLDTVSTEPGPGTSRCREGQRSGCTGANRLVAAGCI
jgi:hypothetical protein